jgi:chaperonin GroES
VSVEQQREHDLAVTLEPLDDFVVVEPLAEESWTRGGLIVPINADEPCRHGIVTATGPDVGGIEPGDKVLFPKEAGYSVRLTTGTVRVLKRDELIARIQD